MMMSGPYLARSQKLAVQHFTLEVNNLFTKATIFIPVFRLLLVMLTLCTVHIQRVDPRVNVRVAATADADARCVYAPRSTISANVIP